MKINDIAFYIKVEWKFFALLLAVIFVLAFNEKSPFFLIIVFFFLCCAQLWRSMDNLFDFIELLIKRKVKSIRKKYYINILYGLITVFISFILLPESLLNYLIVFIIMFCLLNLYTLVRSLH